MEFAMGLSWFQGGLISNDLEDIIECILNKFPDDTRVGEQSGI